MRPNQHNDTNDRHCTTLQFEALEETHMEPGLTTGLYRDGIAW